MKVGVEPACGGGGGDGGGGRAAVAGGDLAAPDWRTLHLAALSTPDPALGRACTIPTKNKSLDANRNKGTISHIFVLRTTSHSAL